VNQPTRVYSRLPAKPTGQSVRLGFSCLGRRQCPTQARKPTTTRRHGRAPDHPVTPTEGGVPNTDDDGRQRERCLHPRFRIDSNEANSSHIGHPSKPSGQIDHEQIEFTPEEDGKTRRQILACRGEIVCFELGAPKGTRTPVFAVRGRRPRPLDDGSDGGSNRPSASYIGGDKSGKSGTSRTNSRPPACLHVLLNL
jgi:hypothetical protein